MEFETADGEGGGGLGTRVDHDDEVGFPREFEEKGLVEGREGDVLLVEYEDNRVGGIDCVDRTLKRRDVCDKFRQSQPVARDGMNLPPCTISTTSAWCCCSHEDGNVSS